MEQRGNIGGWTRIASDNITRGDECPTGWNKSSHDDISYCRSPSDNGGYYPVQFSSKKCNQKVCGMARGYWKGTPDAFGVSNGMPVDGLFITQLIPHQHILSYTVGALDDII